HAAKRVDCLVRQSVREPAFNKQPEYALIVKDDAGRDRRARSEETRRPRMTDHHVACGKAAVAQCRPPISTTALSGSAIHLSNDRLNDPVEQGGLVWNM